MEAERLDAICSVIADMPVTGVKLRHVGGDPLVVTFSVDIKVELEPTDKFVLPHLDRVASARDLLKECIQHVG